MARATAKLLWGLALAVVAGLVLVTLALALSPTYAGITGAVELDPLLTLAHFRLYLARTAIANTGLLAAVVLPVGWGLAWLAHRGRVDPRLHPLLLAPLFLPGPAAALLWRPLLAPWLDLRDANLTLALTGLVLLWRVTPPLLVVMTRDAHGKRSALGLAALLILLDGGLPLLLSGGAPYNAAHTWSSWILQQVWTNRAWGHAAQLAAALALVVGGVAWLSLRRPHADPSPPRSTLFSRPGWGSAAVLLWILLPFAAALLRQADAPDTLSRWAELIRPLLNGASLTLTAAAVAVGVTWARSSTGGSARAATGAAVLLIPLWTVSAAYLAALAPNWAPLLLPLTVGLAAAGLGQGRGWRGAAACVLLVQAQSFALQVVVGLPPAAWTPTLHLVYGVGAAPPAAQAPALLLQGFLAAIGGWATLRFVLAAPPARREVPLPPVGAGESPLV